jgi:hypothetical protein
VPRTAETDSIPIKQSSCQTYDGFLQVGLSKMLRRTPFRHAQNSCAGAFPIKPKDLEGFGALLGVGRYTLSYRSARRDANLRDGLNDLLSRATHLFPQALRNTEHIVQIEIAEPSLPLIYQSINCGLK